MSDSKKDSAAKRPVPFISEGEKARSETVMALGTMKVESDSMYTHDILGAAVNYLLTIDQVLGSESAKRMANCLKIVSTGSAPALPNCEHCAISSPYPVICRDCFDALMKIVVYPGKLIVSLGDGEIHYVAGMSGTMLVLKAINRPDTLDGAIALLDEMKTEDDFRQFVDLIQSSQDAESQNADPSEAPERGN